MKKRLFRAILRAAGWRVEVSTPDYPRCVICVAPHTSNWDFILGELAYGAIGRYAGFLMKKTWFFFPLNLLLRAMGGVPVERTAASSLTDVLADRFAHSPRLAIAVTPEGTRKANPDWKRGFYYIALKAQVPIVLAYIDYKEKCIGMTRSLFPSGDIEKDMAEIKDYYRHRHARYPRNFAL